MITVKPNDFEKYKTTNTDENILFYPNVFTPIIPKIMTNFDDISVKSLTVGLFQLTGKIFRPFKQSNSFICIPLEKTNINFIKDKQNILISCDKGSVILIGKNFRKQWSYVLPKLSINLYEINEGENLEDVFSSIIKRLDYSKSIEQKLFHIKNLPLWKQCPQKYLNLNDIGSGCYANVCKSSIDLHSFAVKISKIKEDALKKAYAKDVSSWAEVYILKQIIRPIIEKKICPNLPLLYETFACDSCTLNFQDTKTQFPCSIMILELASENLKSYLSQTRTVNEIYSALFQIMAGLHTIQINGQILNYDIKKENILVYNIKSGGYWEYKIHGKKFYIPNLGKLFVLNDFGLSRPMSPKYPIYKTIDEKTFRLGSRYAFIENGVFVPFNTTTQVNGKEEQDKSVLIKWDNGDTSYGAEFRLRRKDEKVIPLKSEIKNTDTKKFFDNPEVIPPFEFYNDTQDVLRMFVGGKRTTQKGDHKLYQTVPKSIIKDLKPYIGKSACMKENFFSTDPAQVLAGWFIEKFFSFYMQKPKEMVIESYNVS